MGHHRVKIDPSLAKALLSVHGGETTVFKGLKPDDVKGLKDTAKHHGYMPPKAMSKKPIEAFHNFLQRRGKVFEPKKLTNEEKQVFHEALRKSVKIVHKAVRGAPGSIPDSSGGPAVGAGNAVGMAEDSAYPMMTKSKEQLHDIARKAKASADTSHRRTDPEVAKYFDKEHERAQSELKRRQGDKPWWVKESSRYDEGFFQKLIMRTQAYINRPKVPSRAQEPAQAPAAPAKKKRGRKPLDPEVKANRKASREAFKHSQSPQTVYHKKLQAADYWKDYSDDEIEKFANSPNVRRKLNKPMEKGKEKQSKTVNRPLDTDYDKIFDEMGLKKKNESWHPFRSISKLPKFANVKPVANKSAKSGPGFFKGTYRSASTNPIGNIGHWLINIFKQAHKDAVKAMQPPKKK